MTTAAVQNGPPSSVVAFATSPAMRDDEEITVASFPVNNPTNPAYATFQAPPAPVFGPNGEVTVAYSQPSPAASSFAAGSSFAAPSSAYGSPPPASSSSYAQQAPGTNSVYGSPPPQPSAYGGSVYGSAPPNASVYGSAPPQSSVYGSATATPTSSGLVSINETPAPAPASSSALTTTPTATATPVASSTRSSLQQSTTTPSATSTAIVPKNNNTAVAVQLKGPHKTYPKEVEKMKVNRKRATVAAGVAGGIVGVAIAGPLGAVVLGGGGAAATRAIGKRRERKKREKIALLKIAEQEKNAPDVLVHSGTEML